jgi:hypothetical protein
LFLNIPGGGAFLAERAGEFRADTLRGNTKLAIRVKKNDFAARSLR